MIVYHYTDSARLPHILRDRALKPGSNRIGGYPDPEFVWATSSALGDRTASGGQSEAYMRGQMRLARLAFDSAKFFTWAEVPRRFSAWTPRHVDRLEAAARGKGDPRRWWCHVGPLSLDGCRGIETRSYADKRWLPLEGDVTVYETDPGPDGEGPWLGVEMHGVVHASRRVDTGHGAVSYRFERYRIDRSVEA